MPDSQRDRQGSESGGNESDKRRDAPLRSSEQQSPEPERPETPDETAGQSIQELEDPPQAEGQRED